MLGSQFVNPLSNGSLNLGFFTDPYYSDRQRNIRLTGPNFLAKLLRVLLNKRTAYVTQGLRAPKCRFQLEGNRLTELGLKVGHNREVRAGKSVDTLPVVTHSEQTSPWSVQQAGNQASSRLADV